MKKSRGQALVLVLILLAVGALMIAPVMQMSGNVLQSGVMYREFSYEDYAADAVLEYGMWRLNYEPGYAASLPIGIKSPPFYITVNGVTANATVTPQATGNGTSEQLGGQPLMNNDIFYKVTKTVTPDSANVGVNTTFTYTVSIKSYSTNTTTTKKLKEIRDILSRQFGQSEGYVIGSTSWNISSWGIVPFDPSQSWKDDPNEQYWRLTWDLDAKMPGGIPFEYGETKTFTFQVRGALTEGIWGNDISVNPGERDITGYQAPITVGNPPPNVPFGFLTIAKTSDTDILYPGVAANLTYTVNATNIDVVPISIKRLEDWLPSTGFADPAFVYLGNSTTAFITHTDNSTTAIPMPDTYPSGGNLLETPIQWHDLPYMRYELRWDFSKHQDARFDPIILGVGETLTVSFRVTVTPQASGLYLNEFTIDCERYPAVVTSSPKFENMHPPSSNTTFNVTVNMTNPDVFFTEYKKLFVWLPSDDSGNQSQTFNYTTSMGNPSYVIKSANGSTVYGPRTIDPDDLKKNEWDSRKRRRWLEWDVKDYNTVLQPGETMVWTFRIRSPVNPSLNFNELVWRIEFDEPSDVDYDRTLYSFPTAGVMVPMYDIEAQTLNSILMANAWLGNLATIHTKSHHWKDHH